MMETIAAPTNISVKFKGKRMAKKSSAIADAPQPAKSDRDWDAEDALRTMQRAAEHENDPAMMKRVATHAQKQADGLDGVLAKLRKQGLVSDNQAEKVVNRRKAVRA